MAVWLDDTIGTSTETRWLNVVPQLRQMISHVEVFSNINECIHYVGSTGIEQIFLIVAGAYADNFDTTLYEEIIHNVFIYVLTTNKFEYHGNHASIRGWFDNTATLIDQIYRDYTASTNEAPSGMKLVGMNSIESTTRLINPQMIQWKCYQLMMDILRRMPCPLEQSKEKLLQRLRHHYRYNQNQLIELDEFAQTYQPSNAIKCQLQDLSCRASVQTSSDSFLYRGQLMPVDELQQLQRSIGKFISNNALMPTTLNSHVALVYSGEGCHIDLVSVLIEVSFDSTSVTSKPFADVSYLFSVQYEQEVLLASGHIFRVDSCEILTNNIWYLKLTLCDDRNPIVTSSSDYFDVAILQLLEILPKVSPRTHKVNDRLLQWWRFYAEDDSVEQAKVKEFCESYRSDAAIRWYTKDSLLYRLLNTALRTENIDMISDFRYFIIDLYEQLTKSYLDYVISFKEQNLTVYRGQKLCLSELIKLKHTIGKYISITSFWSASLSSEVALFYAELSEDDKKQFLQSVMFQIDIDMTKLANSCKNHIFANIISLSCFIDEEEVLFMANTQFRIHSVAKHTETLWVVRLVLLNQDDENTDEIRIMNRYL
ncbi:unnamed protein product, partial [Adineta steineri]